VTRVANIIDTAHTTHVRFRLPVLPDVVVPEVVDCACVRDAGERAQWSPLPPVG